MSDDKSIRSSSSLHFIQPIETHYKGYRFRSRLEARWAVFFDSINANWEYEKEGYDLGRIGWYLPDFWIRYTLNYPAEFSNSGNFIEIKGGDPTNLELKRLSSLAQYTNHTSFLLVGPPGQCTRYWAHRSGSEGFTERFDDEISHVIPYGSEYVWFNQLTDSGPIEIRNAVYASRSARFERRK